MLRNQPEGGDVAGPHAGVAAVSASGIRKRYGGVVALDGVDLAVNEGEVFGIIGLGRIGTAAALRAKALGMDVAFYDPYKPDGYDKALGVRRVEKLEELLRQSFVVSVHCPLTEETRHVVDARAIALMPDGSYLVNTARGATVDAAAIPDAIRSGKLAGAAIERHEPVAALT